MELGYKLKKIREIRKLTQQEVSAHIDVSQKTYSNFESCKTAPSTKHLIEISKILSFDFISYLKEEEGVKDFYISNESKSLSEKIKDNLIGNYKIILRDKDEIIKLLKEKIDRLRIEQ